MSKNPIQARFQAAFDSLLEKVKQDRSIIGVYVYGSLIRGDMWQDSDLDVIAITREEGAVQRAGVLIEHGITFHCDVISRSRFRRTHERLLRGSIQHHIFTSGKLVYTTDDSLHEYLEDLSFVGQRDRDMLAFYYGTETIATLHSVQKSLHAHHDPLYMFIWLLEVVRHLACVEIALQGEDIRREALHQAARLNPTVFELLNADLIHGEKDLAALTSVMGQVEAYLQANAVRIFKPLLDYLAEAGEVRGISEVHDHLSRRLVMPSIQGGMRLYNACKWLVEQDILSEISSPVKMTDKSMGIVDEPAYYYDAEVSS